MIEKPELPSDEEIEKVVNDAFNEDALLEHNEGALLEHYVTSRGHWERIALIIAQKAIDNCYKDMLEQFVEFLRTEHVGQFHSPEAGCEIIAIPVEDFEALQDQLEEAK